MERQGVGSWTSRVSLSAARGREALAVLSPAGRSKAAIELGRRCSRGRFARYLCPALPVAAAGPSTERYAAVACTTRPLAVVRGVAGEGRDGEGLGGTLRCGGEHGVPLPSPVSRGGAERFGGTRSWKRTSYVLESRKGARPIAFPLRRSAASRASRCRFSWRRTGAGRRQRGAAQGRCGDSDLAVVEGRPAGLRRSVATHLAPATEPRHSTA